MSITLFPNSERINLTEDITKTPPSYESYTGIVFDTEENRFTIVTGKFSDKKDMYNRMTKRGKYLRRAYETKIFDWIQKNAETPVDGYLMLSTAVSKWKNNNVLSKYYKKLLHDLPYINREGRKGDPQTMGTKASFESVENNNNMTTLTEDEVNLPELEQYLFKAFDDMGDENNNTVKTYNVAVGCYNLGGTNVFSPTTNKKIGTLTNKIVKNDEGTPYNVVIDNEGNEIGYCFFPAGKVFSSLNKEDSQVIGIIDKDALTLAKPEKSEYVTFDRVPAYEERLDHAKGPNSFWKNPILVLRLKQVIDGNLLDNDNHGVYVTYITDPKTGNVVKKLSFNYNQAVPAIGIINQLMKGNISLGDMERKNVAGKELSFDDQLIADYNKAVSKGSNPGNIAHNADMFSDIANAQMEIKKRRDAIVNRIKQLERSGLPEDFTTAKKLRQAIGLEDLSMYSTDWADKADDVVNAWNQQNKAPEQPGAPEKDLVHQTVDKLKSEENPDVVQKAEIMLIKDKAIETGTIRSARDYYNNPENTEELNSKLRDNIEKIKSNKADVEESFDIPSYVNDGASTLNQWTNSTYINSASFQEANTHDTLNQDLFEDKKLRQDVKNALLDIANKFKDSLKIAQEPVDVYFTGSEANYNYNEGSDIDVHLVYDYEKAGMNAEILDKYLQTAKKVFNNNYNITVKGLPVEVGAENIATPLVTSGVYSLINDKWVIEPENANKEIAEPEEPYYNEVRNIIEDAIVSNNSEKIGNAIEFIWDIRKNGLAEEGEFGPSNTLFKKLRNEGILGQLRQAYYDSESEDLSLESAMKEAEFASKDEAKAEISDDLFDKTENEIIDGLMNHYSTEAEAIAKVEDVMKHASDGYKDKLERVITKIKESSTFGNRCKAIIEKALSKLSEANTSDIIKNISDKIAKEYLDNNNGNIKTALDAFKTDVVNNKELNVTDEDKKALEDNGLDVERVHKAINNTVIDSINKIAKDKEFNKDVSDAKNMRPVIQGQEYRRQRNKDLQAPSNFNVKSFVNLFNNEADLGLYLGIIKSRFPVALLDHPRAFYVVDDQGNRISVKGIEQGFNPENLWVHVLEPEVKGRKIAYFNGERIVDEKNNNIGYAENGKAYLDNGTYLGDIDRTGNVIDTKGHYAADRLEAVDAFAMPIEEYREILNNPRNAKTLEAAKQATDDMLKSMDKEDLESVAAVYNYVKGAEKHVNNAQKEWELANQDEPFNINHYDKMTRDLIYIRTQKLGQDPAKVLADYKDRYSATPYYKVTPEMIANIKDESVEEMTEAEDTYYTLSKNPREFINLLNDMGIATIYKDAIITIPDSKVFAGGAYKLAGINKDINTGAKIMSNNETVSNAHITSSNVVVANVDNRQKAIGYAPLPTFDEYVKNPNSVDFRGVFTFVDDNRDKMEFEGIVTGWNKDHVFKLIPVTSEMKRLKGQHQSELKVSIKFVFDLLKLPENSIENVKRDITIAADKGPGKQRHTITGGTQNGTWEKLTDSEVDKALRIMVKGHEDELINTMTKETIGQAYEDYRKTNVITDDLMKLLRKLDPDHAQYLRKDVNGNVRLYVAYGDAPTETPVTPTKSPFKKAINNYKKK